MRKDWVHDYETLSNFFVAVFIDTKSDEKEIFVIHELRNDIEELIAFLERNILLKEWHISFNGLNFDAQITEYILRDKEQLRNITATEAAEYIYSKAQYVIQTKNEGEFLEFKPSEFKIKQVDIFRLNHWDNPAKRSSLKWIQYTMDWANIQDMPIPHGKEIKTQEEIDMIIGYCINDVESTKQIMYLSKKQIALRNTLTKEYNIDLYSASEPRISKELFLHFLSKQTGVSKYELKQLRTFRESIQVKNIILNYVDFKTASFQKLKQRFKEVEINPNETKGGFKYVVQYKGVKTHFGLGGIHGARASGIYESDKDMIIMSSDVTSFYPNLAIRNGWSPAHLPKEDFCNLYEWFFEERKKISKKDVRNYVYKIILNSTYGLSNDKNSFLYDPEFTMRITINGQLSLCMLYEMLTENIPGAIPLMQNTDGLETLIPREYKDKYITICKEWEQITNLQLEHDTYSKIILGDVNNYIAVNDYKEIQKDVYDEIKAENPHYLFKEKDDKFYYAGVKCKGRFEFSDLALHKNKSHLVIPKSIFYYFVHGIEPEDYLKENLNIFDYCAGKKINGNWNFYIEGINSKGVYVKKDLQHTIRYYVSNKGGKIIKYNYSDKRKVQLESGPWNQKLFINAKTKDNFSDYDINYDYYLKKIYNEVDKLQPRTNQLKLF